MCRLALFNAASLQVVEAALGDPQGAVAAFFWELEWANGGEGMGVAALWRGRRPRMRVRKGVAVTAEAAAKEVVAWWREGADWFLFHTRRATAAPVATRHCHPFRVGALLLAHNGHDPLWAHLGAGSKLGAMTDSEAITRTWAALELPPAALCHLSGAFVGFQADHPFVAKDEWSALVGACGAGGAILFASAVLRWLEPCFTETKLLGEGCWMGGPRCLEAFAPGARLCEVSSAARRSAGPGAVVSPEGEGR